MGNKPTQTRSNTQYDMYSMPQRGDRYYSQMSGKREKIRYSYPGTESEQVNLLNKRQFQQTIQSEAKEVANRLQTAINSSKRQAQAQLINSLQPPGRTKQQLSQSRQMNHSKQDLEQKLLLLGKTYQADSNQMPQTQSPKTSETLSAEWATGHDLTVGQTKATLKPKHASKLSKNKETSTFKQSPTASSSSSSFELPKNSLVPYAINKTSAVHSNEDETTCEPSQAGDEMSYGETKELTMPNTEIALTMESNVRLHSDMDKSHSLLEDNSYADATLQKQIEMRKNTMLEPAHNFEPRNHAFDLPGDQPGMLTLLQNNAVPPLGWVDCINGQVTYTAYIRFEESSVTTSPYTTALASAANGNSFNLGSSSVGGVGSVGGVFAARTAGGDLWNEQMRSDCNSETQSLVSSSMLVLLPHVWARWREAKQRSERHITGLERRFGCKITLSPSVFVYRGVHVHPLVMQGVSRNAVTRCRNALPNQLTKFMITACDSWKEVNNTVSNTNSNWFGSTLNSKASN